MDKKRKDSVIRATVDRAALLRGVLMLVTNPMRSLLPAIFLRGVKDEKEQEDAAA